MEIKYGLVKIADFGLSSIGNVQIMDKTKPAPIRWLAPEVLKTAAYMKPSDIWSLAIVYWEIYTDCAEMPYQNLSLNEIQRRVRFTNSLYSFAQILALYRDRLPSHDAREL